MFLSTLKYFEEEVKVSQFLTFSAAPSMTPVQLNYDFNSIKVFNGATFFNENRFLKKLRVEGKDFLHTATAYSLSTFHFFIAFFSRRGRIQTCYVVIFCK